MTIAEAIERLRELQQGDEPSISYEDLEAIIELIKQMRIAKGNKP